MWLLDENTNECLSSHGIFGPCGDTSLWRWRTTGVRNHLVMFEQVIDVVGGISAAADDDAYCLGREMTIGHSHPHTALSKCSRTLLKATSWEYDHDLLILSTSSGLLSKFFGSLCVVRDGDAAATQNCNHGYTRLKVVIHTTRSGQRAPVAADANGLLLANPPKTRHPVEHGEWTCARTGLVFPRNLDDRLPVWPASSGGDGKRDDRQIFMGGDVFTKTVFGCDFKVYTVGLYVEFHSGQKDPSLRVFEGLAEGELANSPAFYAAVAASGATYDRSLLIKLAMTLKSELMIQGLVEELGVSRESALLLKEASNAYLDPEMRRGMEILFTWRHGRPSTGGQEHFEVRMDGILMMSVPNADLAHDFFTQFVHPTDAVSPRAKIAFTSGFPTLLSAQQSGAAKSHAVVNNLQSSHAAVDRPVRRELQSTLPPLRRLWWAGEAAVASTEPECPPALEPLRTWRDRRVMPYLYARAEEAISWLAALGIVESSAGRRPRSDGGGGGDTADHTADTYADDEMKLKTLFGAISHFKNKEQIMLGRWASSTVDRQRTKKRREQRQQRRRWQAQVDSLLMHERVGRRREEAAATAAVVLYLGLMLIVSCPPALVRRTRKLVTKLKGRLRRMQQALSMPTLPSHARSLLRARGIGSVSGWGGGGDGSGSGLNAAVGLDMSAPSSPVPSPHAARSPAAWFVSLPGSSSQFIVKRRRVASVGAFCGR